MANKDKALIEAQLQAKTEAMSRKLQTVKAEVANIQHAAKGVTDNKPLLITVGVVALGAVAGYFFLRRSASESKSQPEQLPGNIKVTSNPKAVQEAIQQGQTVYLYEPPTKSVVEPLLAPVKNLFSQMAAQLIQLGTQIVMDMVQNRLQTLSQSFEEHETKK